MCSRRSLAAIVLLSFMPLAEATAVSFGYCGQLGMAKVRNSRHRTERRCSNIDFRGGQGRNRRDTWPSSFYEGLPGQPDDQVVS
jgi:hypothetical protein